MGYQDSVRELTSPASRPPSITVSAEFWSLRAIALRSDWIGCWDREQEATALAGRALSPDATAVLLHNAAAQCQAQAGSAESARIGSITLLEAIEDALKLVLRNAATLVFNDEADFAKRRCTWLSGS